MSTRVGPQLTPAGRPLPLGLIGQCQALGITKYDLVPTIQYAYELQISCDAENASRYFAALTDLSHSSLPDVEALSMLVATEQSIGRYTEGDFGL